MTARVCTVEVKDNQWWYSGTPLEALVSNAARIVLQIDGRSCELRHSAPGRDRRLTRSFKFERNEDRQFWASLRGRSVTLTLVSTIESIAEASQTPDVITPAKVTTAVDQSDPVAPTVACFRSAGHASGGRPILCIGLDLAWFGGRWNDADAQFDCLAYLALESDPPHGFGLKRVSLAVAPSDEGDPFGNFDSGARLLRDVIRRLVADHQGREVILAIDAPLRATVPPHPPRPIRQQAGEVRRRTCDNLLGASCGQIASAWRPNIQPGAPLTRRVVALLEGLQQDGFTLYPALSKHVVIECFPGEAQWSGAAYGGYGDLSPLESRRYKRCGNDALPLHLYSRYVVDALIGLGPVCGVGATAWGSVICSLLERLAGDTLWVDAKTGCGRGGKLFDDAVDATICLAVATAFAHGQAHVWMDGAGDDGHIIGPGTGQQ